MRVLLCRRHRLAIPEGRVRSLGGVVFGVTWVQTRRWPLRYKYPKPFVRVLGKEMILWVVDSLKCVRREACLLSLAEWSAP